MVMIIIHIAYITWLVTNDAWHAYDVMGGLRDTSRRWTSSYFMEPAILWLAGTVMAEVGARNRGHVPLAKRPRPLIRKNILLINQ